ncbi:MAG: RNA methyltransferase [Deltaproteobacteria bacterium]|nr:RNA methyltransferase [Deltaproteobacteria bacterium]
MAPLYLALVHYPVLNRRGEVIASAITNLDLHDLARCAACFDLPACFVVTPLRNQQALAGRLLKHWCQGVGRELLPERAKALSRLRVVTSIDEAATQVASECGIPPKIWASSAREGVGNLNYAEARTGLKDRGQAFMLLLGTGWGLAPSVLQGAHAVLEPIRGVGTYNHFSVRCAAAIMLDRLLSNTID